MTQNQQDNKMADDSTVKQQPLSTNGAAPGEPDQVSYVDSDTHAGGYCCCIHGWGSGPDIRWYYPWDKGVYRLLGLCCMWYCGCTFVPCLLCKREYRDIVCCSDQCGGNKVNNNDDADDEIADI